MARTGITRKVDGKKAFALLAIVLSLSLASPALAGTGVGAVFNIGVTNTVNAVTTLVGTTTGSMLSITNNSTGTAARALTVTSKSASGNTIYSTNTGGGPALGLSVPAGRAPMKVSSGAAKVINLDADKLDGQDSAAYQKRVVEECPYGSSIWRVQAHGAVDCENKSADADNLDGADSSAFMRSGTYTRTHRETAPPRSGVVSWASCDPGDRVMTGGFMTGSEDFRVNGSRPVLGSDGITWRWEVGFSNIATYGNVVMDITAVCINQAGP